MKLVLLPHAGESITLDRPARDSGDPILLCLGGAESTLAWPALADEPWVRRTFPAPEAAQQLLEMLTDRGRVSLWFVEGTRLAGYPEFLMSARARVRVLTELHAAKRRLDLAIGTIGLDPEPEDSFDWNACFYAALNTLLACGASEFGWPWLGHVRAPVRARGSDTIAQAAALLGPIANRNARIPETSLEIVQDAPNELGARFVIFGGTRGLGAALGRFMQARYKADVTLCGRTAPEAGGSWRKLDVLSYGDVDAALAALQPRDGEPLHVCFAAGSFAAGSLRHTTCQAELERALETKIVGCMNLLQALKNRGAACRVLLMSSLSAADAESGRGLAHYAAANAFLERAAELGARHDLDVCALRLPAVRGVGQAARFEGLLKIASCSLEDAAAAAHRLFAARARGVYELCGVENPAANTGENVAVPSELALGDSVAPYSSADLCRLVREYVGPLPNSPQVTPDTRFEDLGLDSLERIELAMRLRDELNVELPEDVDLARLTIRDLVAHRTATGAKAQSPTRYELLPTQIPFADANGRCTSRVFVVFDASGVSTERLRQSCEMLVARHAALRMRLVEHDGIIAQEHDPRAGPRELELVEDEAEDLHALMERALADDPVPWGLSYCSCPLPTGSLCIGFGAPHVFVDGVSLFALVKEFLAMQRDARWESPSRDTWLNQLRALPSTSASAGDTVHASAASMGQRGEYCQRRLALPGGEISGHPRETVVQAFHEVVRSTIASHSLGESPRFFTAVHGRTRATRALVGNFARLDAIAEVPATETREPGPRPSVVVSHLGLRKSLLKLGLREGAVSCGVVPGASDVAVVSWLETGALCFSLATSAESRLRLNAAELATAIEAAWATKFPSACAATNRELYEWFAQSLQAHAGNIATAVDESICTYEGLARFSDEILRACLADRSGSPVVIRGRAGVATTAAILAAWRAGRGVFAVEPSWPQAHWVPQAHALGCELLLQTSATDATSESLAEEFAVAAVHLDGISVLSGPPERARARLQNGSVAYYLLTSGTTGHAKTVAMRAGAIRAFLEWCAGTFAFSSSDIFLQTASIAFGASIRQLFSPLHCGASAVAVAPAELNAAESFIDRVSTSGATVLNLVPMLAERLLAECRRRALRKLGAVRLVLVGGDVLSAQFAEEWLQWFHDKPQLVNLYGSTETIVNATSCELNTSSAHSDAFVPIGLPRPGFEVQIWHRGIPGRSGQAAGEIVVCSDVLAEGYVDAVGQIVPFPPCPGKCAGVRMYRTGDLGYLRPDGQLVCLGRIASFAKVHGIRVGLAQVEQAIRGFGEVQACCVLAYRARSDSDGLVAFYESAHPLDEHALRAHLEARLPRAYVPEQFQWRSALPRTASGKIRRELMKQELISLPRLAVEQSHEAASMQVEARPLRSAETELVDEKIRQLLADEWQRQLDTVPANDDSFFTSGGDSIQAVEVSMVLGEQLGQPLPSTLLFFHPRFGQLAAALTKIVRERSASPTKQNEVRHALHIAPTRARSQLTPAGHPWFVALPLRGKWSDALRGEVVSFVQQVFAQSGAAQPVERAVEPERVEAMWRQFRGMTAMFTVWLVEHKRCSHDALWVVADHAFGDVFTLLQALGRGREHEARQELTSAVDLVGKPQAEGTLPLAGSALALWLEESRECGVPAGLYAGYRLSSAARQAFGLPSLWTLQAMNDLLTGHGSHSRAGTSLMLCNVSQDDPPGGAELAERLWAGFRAWLAAPDASKRQLEQALLSGDVGLFVSVADLRQLARDDDRFDLAGLRIESDFQTEALPCAVTLLVFRDHFRVQVRGASAANSTDVITRMLQGDASRSVRAGQRLDAALIAYLPARPLSGWLGIPQAIVDSALKAQRATLVDVRSTRFGRAGLIILPMKFEELIRGPLEKTRAQLVQALATAEASGASTVTWGGLLASLLKSRPAMLAELAAAHPSLAMSDGHATTVAALGRQAQTLAHDVFAGGRFTLGIAGLGSVGRGLLAYGMKHFRGLRRVFLFDTPDATEAALRHLESVGHTPTVDVVAAPPLRAGCVLPAEIDLLVGAASASGAFAIDVLAPGTVVIDDSFPPLFAPQDAWDRMNAVRDVFVVSGGGVALIGARREDSLASSLGALARGCLADDFFPGCQAEGLLVARGLLTPSMAREPALDRVEAVAALIESAQLAIPPAHLFRREIDLAVIASLRDRFRARHEAGSVVLD